MPNWCSNTLRVTAPSEKKMDLFLKTVQGKGHKGKSVPLRFSSILPMPEELRFDTGGRTIDGVYCKAWRETGDTVVPVTEQEQDELEAKYGARDWHEWATKNWGTKWDVEDVDLQKLGPTEVLFRFDTAWGPPLEFLHTLAERCQDVHMHLSYEIEGCDGGSWLEFGPSCSVQQD